MSLSGIEKAVPVRVTLLICKGIEQGPDPASVPPGCPLPDAGELRTEDGERVTLRSSLDHIAKAFSCMLNIELHLINLLRLRGPDQSDPGYPISRPPRRVGS